MFLKDKAPRTLALLFAIAGSLSTATAQTPTFFQQDRKAEVVAQSESRIMAELVRGKLNPASTKPGDPIVVQLKDDVKSNGKLVLAKGSTVTGIVRKVRRANGKGEAKGNVSAQSMIEVEWFDPRSSGTASQQLNFALQSIVYTNPLYANQQDTEEATFTTARPARGLVGGIAGTAGAAVSTVGAVGAGLSEASGTASAAASPSIAPVSAQTSSSLQNNFGVSGSELFLVGSGQTTSAVGTTTSMDLFSRMSNDTVITSPSRDFDVSAGAQMQMLVRTSETRTR